MKPVAELVPSARGIAGSAERKPGTAESQDFAYRSDDRTARRAGRTYPQSITELPAEIAEP